MAEGIIFAALLMGALMPIIDLGRPERVLNLLLHGRLQSPILWDILSITTYLAGSTIFLLLPLIPDMALLRDKFTDAPTWRRWIYKIFSFGWRGTPEQHVRLERSMNAMAVLILPIAVMVHTVVSCIFAMTLRPGWHSTVFGPYFVVGAIFSGIAATIVAMAILRKVYHLENTLKPVHFNNLSLLLLALTAMYIYFTFSEYLTAFYGSMTGDKAVLDALFFAEYAPYFWGFVFGGLLLPFFLLALPWTRNIKGYVIASVLVIVGMWIKRFVIIVPALSRTYVSDTFSYVWGVYQPTWVEWSLTAGSFAGFILLYVLFAKFFPMVSIWELEEGVEEAREKEKATEKVVFVPYPEPRS